MSKVWQKIPSIGF